MISMDKIPQPTKHPAVDVYVGEVPTRRSFIYRDAGLFQHEKVAVTKQVGSIPFPSVPMVIHFGQA